MKISTCIYHFLVLNWYIFLNYYIPQHGKEERKLKIFQGVGQTKYLTLINLLLQAIFFGVACLDDVLKRIKGKKDIKFVTAFRDLLFSTLAFPLSMFVFLAFWSLFLYDRDLVYPKDLDNIFPVWLNHAMHTSILPFMLGEVILRPHRYPQKKTGLILLAAGALAYITRSFPFWVHSLVRGPETMLSATSTLLQHPGTHVSSGPQTVISKFHKCGYHGSAGRILWVYSESGQWIYPVFATLSPLGMAVFFSLSYILVANMYLLGQKLNHWKWVRSNEQINQLRHRKPGLHHANVTQCSHG